MIVVCAMRLDQVDAHPHVSPTEAGGYEPEVLDENDRILPATDLSLSLLSFTVGVAACLLVVRAILPTLVQAHCAEIVRDHLDRASRDSGMKVLVIDRDFEPRSQSVRSPHVSASIAGKSIRVDEVAEAPAQPKSMAPPSHVAKQSPFFNIYEENLGLSNQHRSQAKNNQP